MSEQYPNQNPYDAPPPGAVTVEMPARKPIVSYVILAVTVIMYLLQMLSQSILGGDILVYYGARITESIQAGELWRLITPMFLHGSILHIAFNMYALMLIGTGLERGMGHLRFATLYFLSGFAGNVMSFLFAEGISVGASTAIFGLLAAEGVFLFQNRSLLGRQAQRALGNVILIAGVNLLIGLQPGIDNWGHIGGLLGGFLVGWFAVPLWDVEGVSPLLRIVDRREGREIVVGSALLLLVFGALAFIGMGR